jgi:nicotinamide-nucleotide amidase
MAAGVIARTGVEVGAAVTGVAGPGPDVFGTPEGTVHVAVATPAGVRHRALTMTGGRAAIRAAAVTATLELLCEAREALPIRRSVT